MEYTVYAKLDDKGYVMMLNSSGFVKDAEGWVEIDKGCGDRYHHAQGNYLPMPVVTDDGAYRYKYTGTHIVECSDKEIMAQIAEAEPFPTLEKRIKELEIDSGEMKEALEMILSEVTE